MGLNKGFMAVIFLLVCVLFITLTTHGWDFYQQSIALRSTKQQYLRKDLLRKHCAGVNQSLDDLKDTNLKNFIVDDKHGIIYCYIPKVACTNWKRTLIALNYSEPYPDPMSFEHNWVHHFDRFNLLTDFPLAERKAKLKHYTKFLFVRDPFVRLISAYRDKMLNYDQYFYEGYVRVILQFYTKLPNLPYDHEVAQERGLQPSFYNFIQYLLDPQTEKKLPFEPHWRQMFRLCHPCLVEYDFVGHQETLQEDAQELLKMLNLEDDIKFPPSYENMTSRNSVEDFKVYHWKTGGSCTNYMKRTFYYLGIEGRLNCWMTDLKKQKTKRTPKYTVSTQLGYQTDVKKSHFLHLGYSHKNHSLTRT